MTRKLSYVIDEDFAGRDALAFLKAHGFSSRTISAIKRNPHGLLVKNKKITVRRVLKKGDRLTVYIKEGAHAAVKMADIPINAPYEDRDVIVCDKPAGLSTHPGPHGGLTLVNALAHRFYENGDDCAVRPVSRLDKDTSGLIVVAKNAHAAGVLGAQLKDKRLRREYLAIVEGCPENDEGIIDAPISRAPGSAIKRQVDFENGVNAVTNYKVIRRGAFSLLRLWLDTGRTHQIRVHMAYIGHPLAGDFLYGREFSGGISRQALHSAVVEFDHPVTGEHMRFELPLPDDMKKLMEENE